MSEAAPRSAAWFPPKRLATRLALVVVVAVAAAQLAIFAAMALFSGDRVAHARDRADLGAMVAAARLLSEARPHHRDALFERFRRAFPELELATPEAALGYRPARGPTPLGDALGPGFQVVDAPPGAPPRFGVLLPSGAALTWPRERPLGPPPFEAALLVGLAVLACAATLLSFWAARAVAAPLARFEAAVAHVAQDAEEEARFPVEGPVEFRRLAVAFNEMRDRIRRLIDDHTRMLAAISHDLRTPITRLRLRVEEVGDGASRADITRDMARDLALMERMTRSALAFLSSLTPPPLKRAPTDLPALLQTLCDDHADLGDDVAYDGPERLTLACDADRIRRAVDNLVDNAVKYGGAARVRLEPRPDGAAAILVEDDGPGLGPGEVEAIKRPFTRGDEARTFGARSGFGLGLAIATEAAEAHGGGLELENRAGGGLRATLILPAG